LLHDLFTELCRPLVYESNTDMPVSEILQEQIVRNDLIRNRWAFNSISLAQQVKFSLGCLNLKNFREHVLEVVQCDSAIPIEIVEVEYIRESRDQSLLHQSVVD